MAPRLNKPTLLEQALAIPRLTSNGNYDPEEIELALAWLEGKVSITQIAKVMKIPAGSVQSKMSVMLRNAYQAGRLTVKD